MKRFLQNLLTLTVFLAFSQIAFACDKHKSKNEVNGLQESAVEKLVSKENEDAGDLKVITLDKSSKLANTEKGKNSEKTQKAQIAEKLKELSEPVQELSVNTQEKIENPREVNKSRQAQSNQAQENQQVKNAPKEHSAAAQEANKLKDSAKSKGIAQGSEKLSKDSATQTDNNLQVKDATRAQSENNSDIKDADAAQAQNDNSLEVIEFVLANQIDAREPKIVDAFAKEDQRAFAFARLNVKTNQDVTFRWMHNDHEHARQTLPVHMAKKWRTYSSIKLKPGQWKVQLLSEDKVIAEKSFTLE